MHLNPTAIFHVDAVSNLICDSVSTQGKNPAVNRLASVVVPSVLGLAALAVVIDGAHKLYTGKGKME